MNVICNFNLCTLSDSELLEEINKQTDNIFISLKIPIRHVPAEPNKDYDLLIGELLKRFKKAIT